MQIFLRRVPIAQVQPEFSPFRDYFAPRVSGLRIFLTSRGAFSKIRTQKDWGSTKTGGRISEIRVRINPMRSLFNIIRVLWLFLWAGIATIVLAVPIISAGLLSRTGNLGFSLSKIWAWTMLAVSFVRKGSLVVRPGKIQVVVGEPIDTGSYTHENVDALIDKTRRTVIANFDPGYAGRFFA